MRRGRILTAVLAVVAAMLLTAAGAIASSPGQAFDGLAGTSHDATAEGYPPVTTPTTTTVVTTTTVTTTETTPTTTATTPTPPATTPTPPTTGNTGGVQVQTQQPVTQQVAGAQHTVQKPTPSTNGSPLGATHTQGTLPFTGAQLGVFAAVGLALLAGGLLLRRAGRSTGERA